MGWLDDITDSMNMSISKFWEMVKDREAWHSAAHRVTESDTTEQLSTHTLSIVYTILHYSLGPRR